MANSRTSNVSGSRPPFGHAVINNLNDVNFQFEFPKFGQLPGPPSASINGASSNGRTSNSQSPPTNRSPSDGTNPSKKADRHGSTGSNPTKGLDTQTKDDLAKLSGIFSPPLTNNNVASASSHTSTDSHNSGAPTTTSSPSASSHSNRGSSSSCGTSPEPFTQSPVGFKPVDTLMTIGEEKQQPSFANTNQGKKWMNSLYRVVLARRSGCTAATRPCGVHCNEY